MATWLDELSVAPASRQGEDPLVSGARQLALRVAYGLLLFVVSSALLPHLSYFRGSAMERWVDFLPWLFLVLALLSLPASFLLTSVVLGWAILYESPAAAIWYVFTLLLLLGVYEDRREHALLLASTPGLLLLPMGLGFLPTFLIGIFYGAKRGLMNGFGCVMAIAVAAVLGFTSYPPDGGTADGVIVTGFESPEVSIVGTGAVLSNPSGIFDFTWIEIGTKEGGELTWEGGTKSVAAFVERWAKALGSSPVSLALPLLWGLVAIATNQLRLAGELILGRPGMSDWLRRVMAQVLALVGGILLFMIGYSILGIGGQLGQLFNSALVTLFIIIIVGAFRLFVEERQAWPSWAPAVAALLQRVLRPVQPGGRPSNQT